METIQINLRDKICGVYGIFCMINNRVYVGASIDVFYRWKTHLYELRKGTHDNRYLMSCWTKLGEESFRFVLLEVSSKEEVWVREKFWITVLYDPFNIAEPGFPPSALGRKFTVESLEKMRRSQANRPPATEETRQSMRFSRLGKKMSDVSKKKIKESLLGQVRSSETVLRIRDSWTEARREAYSRTRLGMKHKSPTSHITNEEILTLGRELFDREGRLSCSLFDREYKELSLSWSVVWRRWGSWSNYVSAVLAACQNKVEVEV